MKEYTGFLRNFHHKEEATMFAKIILYIKCYQLSCLRSPYIFEMTLRDSVELTSVAPFVALLSAETAVKPHACEML